MSIASRSCRVTKPSNRLGFPQAPQEHCRGVLAWMPITLGLSHSGCEEKVLFRRRRERVLASLCCMRLRALSVMVQDPHGERMAFG